MNTDAAHTVIDLYELAENLARPQIYPIDEQLEVPLVAVAALHDVVLLADATLWEGPLRQVRMYQSQLLV